MRIAMQVTFPTETFNEMVRDGEAGPALGRILEDLKPEACYFTEQAGERGAFVVVDCSGPSDIPRLAEPWFMTFDALVEFRVCMTPDDLEGAGLDALGKKWG